MAPGNALPAPAGPQKHRACDECRFRKIACSKEPGGCLRCQKEGINCVYSPQKPMGRPRKRRHPPENTASSTVSASVPVTAAQSASLLGSASASTIASVAPPAAVPLPPASVPTTVSHSSSLLAEGDAVATASYGDAGHHHHHQHHQHNHHHHHQHHLHNATAHHHNHHQQPLPSTELTDHALDLLSQSLPSDTSYLDLLPDYDSSNSYLFGMDDNAAYSYFSRDSQGLFDGVGMPVMNMGQADPLEGISFDETDTMSKDLNESLQRYMVSQYLQPPTPSEPSPSTHSSNCFEPLGSTGTDTTSPELGQARPHPTSSCDCLTSLSMALGSLNRLPSDVLSAMRVAREATKIAHDTLNCAQCYQDMFDLSKPPPISRFQSMMCLGALVPSACNAYASILEMVDRDTERAKQENQMLYFSYKDVGGIWTRVAAEDSAGNSPDCELLRSYNNRFLEPDTWRTTMRAILKVEVYGFNNRTASAASSLDCNSSCSYVNVHRGLKDVVTLLDEKNQRRHDIADALMQSNQHHIISSSPYFLMSGPPKPCPREDRHCMRMLDMARMALSNLVIT
ncbi:Zn2Cys6 transcriptional regulator [Trichoderma guizhouense]|uniref:Zn2Cys6 transcriptional regulator n=1 Tax=Trichoderma guizhouense TaxID=1491466 RepID=A0A1T3D0I1_9HYPO|nr:Zn2Cys6 transcriptional regulator [Trichoderma guizhouense]